MCILCYNSVLFIKKYTGFEGQNILKALYFHKIRIYLV